MCQVLNSLTTTGLLFFTAGGGVFGCRERRGTGRGGGVLIGEAPWRRGWARGFSIPRDPGYGGGGVIRLGPLRAGGGRRRRGPCGRGATRSSLPIRSGSRETTAPQRPPPPVGLPLGPAQQQPQPAASSGGYLSYAAGFGYRPSQQQ